MFAALLDRGHSPCGRWFNLIFIVVLLGQIGSIIVGQWLRTNTWQLHIPFF
jgi:hypothetical protein